jgi:hypothetical protein
MPEPKANELSYINEGIHSMVLDGYTDEEIMTEAMCAIQSSRKLLENLNDNDKETLMYHHQHGIDDIG